MWVQQGRGELDLAPKALEVDGGSHLGRKDLHDDAASERLITSNEHAAHSTARELLLKDVAAAERLLQLLSKIFSHVCAAAACARGAGPHDSRATRCSPLILLLD